LFKWIQETDLSSYTLDGLILTDKQVKQERRNICNVCPSRKGILCSECGCIIRAKTCVAFEKCPIDKWLPIEK
jgi:hypothetical protein